MLPNVPLDVERHPENPRLGYNAPHTSMPQWRYYSDGEEVGPIDEQAIRALLAEGRLSFDGLVQREDWTEWRPLRDVPEFATDPALPAAPAAPVLDYESRTSVPFDSEGWFHANVSGFAAGLCIGLLGTPSYGSSFQIGSSLMAFGAGMKALSIMREKSTSRGRWLAVIGMFVGMLGLVGRIVLWCVHYFR